MANNQSWEFYQQPDTGTKYPLQWIAGCVTAPFLQPLTLKKDRLYLIPFNQMRAATLSKIGVNVTTLGAAGAAIRLGIYANNGSADNYPKGLVLDAGTVSAAPGAGAGAKLITNLNTNLTADTRYWAALITNDSTVGVSALSEPNLIFWGADTSSGVLLPAACVNLIGLTQLVDGRSDVRADSAAFPPGNAAIEARNRPT